MSCRGAACAGALLWTGIVVDVAVVDVREQQAEARSGRLGELKIRRASALHAFVVLRPHRGSGRLSPLGPSQPSSSSKPSSPPPGDPNICRAFPFGPNGRPGGINPGPMNPLRHTSPSPCPGVHIARKPPRCYRGTAPGTPSQTSIRGTSFHSPHPRWLFPLLLVVCLLTTLFLRTPPSCRTVSSLSLASPSREGRSLDSPFRIPVPLPRATPLCLVWGLWTTQVLTMQGCPCTQASAGRSPTVLTGFLPGFA